MMQGSCLCGNVHYTVSAEPVFTGKCYCLDCQKESGTGHSTAVAVPKPALKAEGVTQAYTKQADSGGDVTRSFCPSCGTTLFVESSGTPGLTIIRAGTLDEVPAVEVNMAVFCASQRPWDRPAEGMVQFERMPPQG